MTQVEKPVALVTGGASGVGAATARHLASRGIRVAVNYRSREEAAKVVAAECTSLAGDSMLVAGDVSKDSDCRKLVDAVLKKWGQMDSLICSAAYTQFTDLSDFAAQNSEDFHRIFDVNVLGPFQLARAAVPYLRKSGRGSIVNVSSLGAKVGGGSSLAYIASKGALNAMTMALARLMAPEIRVNAVLPGLLDTEWFLAGHTEAEFEAMKTEYKETVALGSVVSPEDVAKAIVYLAIDATQTAGEFLVVDGGYLLGR